MKKENWWRGTFGNVLTKVEDLPGPGLKVGVGLLRSHLGDPVRLLRREMCCTSFGTCASYSYARWQMMI